MKTALFTNFTEKEFIGAYNGKLRKFEPGESQYMPDGIARLFAKHLTNRELLKLGKERSTSPKKPEDVPDFMEIFNKAYTPDVDTEFVGENDSVDVQIAVANKSRQQRIEKASNLGKPGPTVPAVNPESENEQWKEEANAKPDPTKPQVVLPPDFDEEDEESQVEPKV